MPCTEVFSARKEGMRIVYFAVLFRSVGCDVV